MDKQSCWTIAEQVAPHVRTLLLYGVPDTGKSRFGVEMAQAGQKVRVITLNEDTAASELIGHNVLVNGNMEFKVGLGFAAWLDGGLLVINEPDRASGEALTVLYAILDDQEVAVYTLPNGETIKPKPGFRVVATMNGSPAELPEALQRRFPVSINVDAIRPEALKELPSDLRDAAAQSAVVEDIERRIYLSQWQAFAKLRNIMDRDFAAQAVFGVRGEEVINALKIAKETKE